MDSQRIDFACGFFHFAWIDFTVLIIGIVLLIVNLGASALAGIAFFFLVAPTQVYIMKAFVGIRRKTMVWTDKRAKLLQELLGGMKIIKFFAWEDRWIQRAMDSRKHELKWLVKSRLNSIMFQVLWTTAPILVSVISFLTFVAQGNELTLGVAFTVSSDF